MDNGDLAIRRVDRAKQGKNNRMVTAECDDAWVVLSVL